MKSHTTADCREITNFKQQKKAHFEAKSGPENKSLALFFEEVNVLKRQLKPEKTASSKKRKTESLIDSLYNRIRLKTSYD
jgi:hypothetical protein